jgi:hypothetical protein
VLSRTFKEASVAFVKHIQQHQQGLTEHLQHTYMPVPLGSGQIVDNNWRLAAVSASASDVSVGL